MSNIKSTNRRAPLSRVVVAGALTDTPGKMAITEATEGALGTDSRGTVVGNAHFSVVGSPAATCAPYRYLTLCCVATGTAAATLSAYLIVQFWHATAEQWIDSAPMQLLGVTGLDADQTEVGGILSLKVPRGATAGRFYLRGLATDQGVDITVDADNDD